MRRIRVTVKKRATRPAPALDLRTPSGRRLLPY
jgi:hypothetical protein